MEFSIDSSIDAIYDKKTKRIFKEVISSFNNGNYRSAIVMLYTVVICDLIYKMQDLNDMYQDKNAEKILSYIETKQQQEKNSSKWEDELVKKVGEETELLSSIEVEEIIQLKKYRNLSAHPVLKHINILYVPTRELTYAQIRTMVEAVLSKPPLLSRKITESFLDDLSLHGNDFIIHKEMLDVKSLGVFLKIRYFRFMGDTLRKILFKDLWKFVFKIENVDCDKNRIINFYALNCLYKEAKDVIKPYIEGESSLFTVKKEYMLLLYEFILKHSEVYRLLSEDVKIEIDATYKTMNEDIIVLSAFLKKNLEEHCKDIIEFFKDRNIKDEHLQKSLRLLYEYSDEKCKSFSVLRSYIEVFSQSSSYKDAEDKLRVFIIPYLMYMEGEEFSLLINSIKQNRQIYESHYVINNLSYIENYARRYFGEDYSLKSEINTI